MPDSYPRHCDLIGEGCNTGIKIKSLILMCNKTLGIAVLESRTKTTRDI